MLRAKGVKRATLVGFSTGGGEVARYIGRHGTARVAKVAFVSAVTPIMGASPTNPNGVPEAVFVMKLRLPAGASAEDARDLATDPAPPAGDQRNAPGEVEGVRHAEPPWRSSDVAAATGRPGRRGRRILRMPRPGRGAADGAPDFGEAIIHAIVR